MSAYSARPWPPAEAIVGTRILGIAGRFLQALADEAEDAGDRAAQEEQGYDRGDRDQSQDERVFGKSLAAGEFHWDLLRSYDGDDYEPPIQVGWATAEWYPLAPARQAPERHDP
jgi:hypothetical protein